MNWFTDWKALAARIQGLIDAGTFFFRAQHTGSADNMSVKKTILFENAKNIFKDLNKFLNDYRSLLPTDASKSLQDFLQDPNIVNLEYNPRDKGSGAVQFALTSLAAFCSEFTYLLVDTQTVARRITERAFKHLQRSIVVDSEIRNKWIHAFNKTERVCEKLGAVHLLLHGVWAFKIDALGGRTDLVLNEPLSPLSEIESSADVLVLTEWKLVKEQKELEGKIKEATEQVGIYSVGVLGGIELANYRYLIMVSEREMTIPDDRVYGIVRYRHINIAVNPAVPSLKAKSKVS